MSEIENMDATTFRKDEPRKELVIADPNNANKYYVVAGFDSNIELCKGYTTFDGSFVENAMTIPLEVVPELIDALKELSEGT